MIGEPQQPPIPYDDAVIIERVFAVYGDGESENIRQLNVVKRLLESSSDDELLALHGEAADMSDESDASDAAVDAAFLVEDALACMPYLDLARAVRVYNQMLDPDEVGETSRGFIPVGLMHVTYVAGDEAMPLWRRVLGDEFLTDSDLREDAAYGAARAVLKKPEEFRLSVAATQELGSLATLGR